MAYIAAVACVVAAPGLLMAGAAGAVVAADAEVRAYTAAVAYLVAEKGGLRPPFSYAWMRLQGYGNPPAQGISSYVR